VDEIDKLLSKEMNAFSQPKIAEHVRQLAFGNLTCLGRHTISGMLTASGNQFMDWTSSYDMFSEQRVDVEKLFDVSLASTIEELESTQMIIGHMDDTIVKKTGKKIPGTAWRRDPLGPPFHTNFIWGQRFILTSLALPNEKGPSQSRAIPINFHHCPTVKKPIKTATTEQINTFKEHQKQAKLSKQGSLQIKSLRDKLDQQGHDKRILCMGVDGSYTNETVLKSLPERVTLIGRIRKDCKLYEIPEQSASKSKGRKKVYGERIPTPEQIRQSDEYEWQKVKAWAVGKVHEFNVKVVKDLKWRSAGETHTLQLMVIRPLGYRPNKTSKILYREPAYFICTDNNLNAEELLQAYIWRWEIEVNIRDEKTLLGCGQAQVRNEHSAADVPAFVTAMYSFLLLANHKAFKDKDRNNLLPRPKWYPAKADERFTTGDLVNHLRTELWAKGLGTNFSGFVKKEHQTRSRRNKSNPLSGALFYSRR
jgi:hypothetical protein